MLTSARARALPSACPSHIYLSLAEDPDHPLETKPSVGRTCVLAAAAVALIAGAPLYWAASADGANKPVATLASKDSSSGEDVPDDACGPGDDPDGTTAPGATTSTRGGAPGTSTAGTSAPGVTTAPGGTSEGGDQTTGQRDTTLGQDTSTGHGDDTSTGGHATNTTAGETDLTRGVQEDETFACEPVVPPAITPPTPAGPQPQPQAQPQPGPGVTPGAQQPVPQVLPERAARPTARLLAPAGCPPQSFFARVRGRGIVSVRFTLDGRRFATVYRPDRTGTWKVRVNTRKLSTGTHRIVARVTFDTTRSAAYRQVSGEPTRMLSVTFSKCARRAQAPAFTG